jgi:hypothetical protein
MNTRVAREQSIFAPAELLRCCLEQRLSNKYDLELIVDFELCLKWHALY